MRDIVHPYLGLGSIPIRSPRDSVADRRESPEMEQIRAEILHLGQVNGRPPDWRAIVDCAVVILRDQRKDIQVGCYVCWGLFETEGYAGLAVGLTIVKDMVALYWDTLHPPVDRLKARLASLDWLAGNLAGRIDRKIPIPGDIPALEKALQAFVGLEESLGRRFGRQAPPFGHARRQVAEHLGRLPGPKPQPVLEMSLSERPSPPIEETTRKEILPVLPLPQVKSEEIVIPPPSMPCHSRRILTPAERAQRRLRRIFLAVVLTGMACVAGAGWYYWHFEVKRLDRVASDLLSPEMEARADGYRALSALSTRQRLVVLRTHQEALLQHYTDLATEAASRYDFIAAQEFLDVATDLYPDSFRLAEVRSTLRQRELSIKEDSAFQRAELRSLIVARLTSTVTENERKDILSMLDRMIQLISQGDLRNAREQLNALAVRLSSEDPLLFQKIPDLAAFAVIELAETEMERDHFTRALQLVTDGVVFLPDHPLLSATRKRYLIHRSEYLLRRTLEDISLLKSMLVRQASVQLREDVPTRYEALRQEIVPVLMERIALLAKTDFSAAQSLSQAFDAVFPEDNASLTMQ